MNQGPADLQSAALTTELCTHIATEITRLCSETKDLMDRWVIDSVSHIAPRLARCEDSNPIGEPHSVDSSSTRASWCHFAAPMRTQILFNSLQRLKLNHSPNPGKWRGHTCFLCWVAKQALPLVSLAVAPPASRLVLVRVLRLARSRFSHCKKLAHVGMLWTCTPLHLALWPNG